MVTSSITANFYCDDAKAANAFVRMLGAPPVKVIKPDSNACHAEEFKSNAEMRAFCLKMARVARKRVSARKPTVRNCLSSTKAVVSSIGTHVTTKAIKFSTIR